MAGAADMVRRARDWPVTRRFDLATLDTVTLRDAGYERAETQDYVPSAWIPTARAFRRLGLGAHDVVADIGAGKGLALLVAGSHPVKRVIGVEFVPEFAQAARDHVARNRPQLAAPVEVANTDVLEWAIPDDLSVVYMFSPFYGELMQRFLERLIDSVDRKPRPLRLVYTYPGDHKRIMATGRARVIDVIPGQTPGGLRWWRGLGAVVTYAMGDAAVPRPRGLPANPAALRHWRTRASLPRS